MVEVESPDEETDLAREVAVLAQTPAGPGLAALLADLDVSALTDSECVEVLRARYRQASHERGELFTVITEVIDRVSRDSESPRHEHPDWQGSAEVGAALVLTTRGRGCSAPGPGNSATSTLRRWWPRCCPRRRG